MNNSLSFSSSDASKASTASNASTAYPQKILILTYYWPPCGGAGVQRWLKFARYLPEFGWEPVILTVDPAYAAYPAVDTTLEDEVPADIRVEKTRALNYFALGDKKRDGSGIPSAGFASGDQGGILNKLARFARGNFFIPDPRRGWNKFAFRRASRLITDLDIKYVVTTSPPHSTQLIGIKLKRRFPTIKWIADLRDPWTGIYYYKSFYPTILSRAIDSSYERRTIKLADHITTVGNSLRKSFIKVTSLPPERISVIHNGYDENDFRDLDVQAPIIPTITYTGTLSEQYPTGSLVRSLKRLVDIGIIFRFRFAGTIPDKIREEIIAATGPGVTEFIPYVNHHQAIEYMSGSSVLLLIIPEHPGNRSIITGKLFEYMAAGKPVLCIGPADGDAADILEKSKAGATFNYHDHEGITSFLESNLLHPFSYPPPAEYSRKNILKHLIKTIK